MKKHPLSGQASVEYLLLISLLIIVLFTGMQEFFLENIDIYFQDMAYTLNLPIP
jgi:uncharacterized protein (UPF0333 family)